MTRSVFNHRRGATKTFLLLSTDTFNRGIRVSNLGNTDGSGRLDPLTWTNRLSTWNIPAQDFAQQSTTSADGIVTVPLTTPDVDITLQTKVALDTGAAAGVVFRWVDNSNYWRFVRVATSGSAMKWRLFKTVSGTDTQVGSDVTATTSLSVNCEVIANADSIVCKNESGTTVASTSDTFNLTATTHGMFAHSTTSTDGTDNWSASGWI